MTADAGAVVPQEVVALFDSVEMTDEERNVLVCRMGLDRDSNPRTFAEAARVLNRDMEEIRRIEVGALSRLPDAYGR